MRGANVDDVVLERANLIRALRDGNLHNLWLMHRHLQHVSFGYLKHMLPSLFSGMKDSKLKCVKYVF